MMLILSRSSSEQTFRNSFSLRMLISQTTSSGLPTSTGRKGLDSCQVFLLHRIKLLKGSIFYKNVSPWMTCTGSSGQCTGSSRYQAAADLWDDGKMSKVKVNHASVTGYELHANTTANKSGGGRCLAVFHQRLGGFTKTYSGYFQLQLEWLQREKGELTHKYPPQTHTPSLTHHPVRHHHQSIYQHTSIIIGCRRTPPCPQSKVLKGTEWTVVGRLPMQAGPSKTCSYFSLLMQRNPTSISCCFTETQNTQETHHTHDPPTPNILVGAGGERPLLARLRQPAGSLLSPQHEGPALPRLGHSPANTDACLHRLDFSCGATVDEICNHFRGTQHLGETLGKRYWFAAEGTYIGQSKERRDLITALQRHLM